MGRQGAPLHAATQRLRSAGCSPSNHHRRRQQQHRRGCDFSIAGLRFEAPGCPALLGIRGLPRAGHAVRRGHSTRLPIFSRQREWEGQRLQADLTDAFWWYSPGRPKAAQTRARIANGSPSRSGLAVTVWVLDGVVGRGGRRHGGRRLRQLGRDG